MQITYLLFSYVFKKKIKEVRNFPPVMVHAYALTLFQQKPNCSCYITISSTAPWQLGRVKIC